MKPLIRLIPPALVRFFARPYVAGDSLAKAMEVCAALWQEKRFCATLDLLAEAIADEATVRRNIDTYLAMIDAVADDTRFQAAAERPSLSLKPSSYTTDPLERGGKAERSREAVFEICEHAKTRGVALTIDMEDRHWTDFTLELLRDLRRAGYEHVGAVLQTRLNRTAEDLSRIPEGMRVRLVIGIYQEPASVAVSDKRVMKQRLLDYAKRLLERGHFVEFATHDEPWVRRFVDQVVPSCGVTPDRFELQMLYGVPRERLLGEMRRRGLAVRLYVPFALSWPMAIAYLRRRLDEYPAMMLVVCKNLLRRG